MTKQLKFRAWNGEQMVSPDYIDRAGLAHWKENGIPEITDKVMQFTGVTDKNGVDIFEWDIVKVRGKKSVGIYITEIVDCKQGWTLKENKTYYKDSACMLNCEVIGNIYANSELL